MKSIFGYLFVMSASLTQCLREAAHLENQNKWLEIEKEKFRKFKILNKK